MAKFEFTENEIKQRFYETKNALLFLTEKK